MKQSQKALPYLLANIFLVDLPLFILGSGMILNNISPEFFQGTTLTVTEYIINTCFLSIIISIPVIRFFECRKVLKLKNLKNSNSITEGE